MANQKVREFIEQLSSQAGVDVQSEDFKKLLLDPKLLEIEVPETVAEKIQESLITRHTAMNDSEIASHFKVKYYKTIENGLKRSLKAAGYTDEQLAELEAEKDTLKRLEVAIPKFAEHVKSLSKSTGEGDEKYTKAVAKFNELQTKYEALDTEWQKKETQWKSDLENKEVNWEVNNHLGAYQFSDTLTPEDARLVVSNKLTNSPYIFKKVEGKLGVYQKENPDLVATKNNKSLTIKDVLDEAAAPYIKKAAGAPATGAKQATKVVDAGGDGKTNSFAKSSGKNAAILEGLKSQKIAG